MYYIILSLIKKLEKQWSHATSKWIQENYVEKITMLDRLKVWGLAVSLLETADWWYFMGILKVTSWLLLSD